MRQNSDFSCLKCHGVIKWKPENDILLHFFARNLISCHFYCLYFSRQVNSHQVRSEVHRDIARNQPQRRRAIGRDFGANSTANRSQFGAKYVGKRGWRWTKRLQSHELFRTSLENARQQQNEILWQPTCPVIFTFIHLFDFCQYLT